MELCTDGTLLDLINSRNDNIPEKNILFILKEVTSGIYHMHTRNPPISHRDIKIENVLRFGNNFKLCDFGSASTLTLDPKTVEKSKILEHFSRFEKITTAMYRPPEMCDQYSKYPVNEKVDVWMLGCILYTLMFKQQPFQDAQKLSIINAHYFIPDNHSYSEKLLDFCRLMLTPNPINRPSTNDVLGLITNWDNANIELPVYYN
jgi:AP2-associated kinase